ncbi:hypothetical protein Tco_0301045 [Tanacetum coccineum]
MLRQVACPECVNYNTVIDHKAASLYYILQEQNNRIHANGASCARSVERVAIVILDIVRLKLGTIKFKRNARVAKLKTT